MSALPLPSPAAAENALPNYLPVRMVNEFVYCPRLFFYEWVEGVFRESADTVEGSLQHRRVDAGSGALPAASDSQSLHARSVTLSSERLRVIAKLDLIDLSGGEAVPVDYKHGGPKDGPDGAEAWEPDRVQIALQAQILRENGYVCNEGVVYYQKTKQRVRIPVDAPLSASAEAAVSDAWTVARARLIPPPLIDSPKCAGCSLNPICLPDETNTLTAEEAFCGQLGLFPEIEPVRKPVGSVRRLMAPRDDLKPVYLNTQGARLGRSGGVLQVKEKDKLLQEIRLNEICQLNVMGNVQVSTQAVQALCEAGVPVCYFSTGAWFYGITTGLNARNVFLRQSQFHSSDSAWFARKIARALVAGKIRNQRVLLQRNHIEPEARNLAALKRLAEDAEQAPDLQSLLGIEGYAARIYFGSFSGMIKGQDDDPAASGSQVSAEFTFDFEGRNRRPPRDPVNALLSLAYSLLAKDLTIACYAMDTLVTHPLFEYRMSYRRLLEVQARLLARVLEGEISAYPAFVTR